MIKYSLVCGHGHEFEGWFQSGAAYDVQARDGQLACPHCGSGEIGKAIMAPAVATRSAEGSVAPAALFELFRRVSDEVRAKAEYVGPRFADEARKIHLEESPERGIYGEASRDEVEALADEGIAVYPMLPARDEMN